MCERLRRALDKLAKWRTVFAGWQLGTRPTGDPECDAVRDHRELSILLRAEVSALTTLLVAKGVFSGEEWQAALENEAALLDKSYERRFPGFSTTVEGVVMKLPEARVTTRGWKP